MDGIQTPRKQPVVAIDKKQGVEEDTSSVRELSSGQLYGEPQESGSPPVYKLHRIVDRRLSSHTKDKAWGLSFSKVRQSQELPHGFECEEMKCEKRRKRRFCAGQGTSVRKRAELDINQVSFHLVRKRSTKGVTGGGQERDGTDDKRRDHLMFSVGGEGRKKGAKEGRSKFFAS